MCVGVATMKQCIRTVSVSCLVVLVCLLSCVFVPRFLKKNTSTNFGCQCMWCVHGEGVKERRREPAGRYPHEVEIEVPGSGGRSGGEGEEAGVNLWMKRKKLRRLGDMFLENFMVAFKKKHLNTDLDSEFCHYHPQSAWTSVPLRTPSFHLVHSGL